ncbi:hypothetical protein NDU88_007829 [Pleurodeles waltl]|uniref:Uncharacterized protein n=1 Tax=Pleurodeles waltl TaxID=8319 RepID=A0AAV7PR46_PLEWA|nr:hypothetical protein NDU88_007829 [Pleurodeles waltl]
MGGSAHGSGVVQSVMQRELRADVEEQRGTQGPAGWNGRSGTVNRGGKTPAVASCDRVFYPDLYLKLFCSGVVLSGERALLHGQERNVSVLPKAEREHCVMSKSVY